MRQLTGLEPAFQYYNGGLEQIDSTTCVNCDRKARKGQTLDWFIGENKTIWWHFDLTMNCTKRKGNYDWKSQGRPTKHK